MAGKIRKPHKDGCLCVICKAKRAKLEALVPVKPERVVLPPPTEVSVNSLPSAAKFMLGGQEYRVGQKFEGMVVCYNLFTSDSTTLGGATKVKPIK